MHGFVRGFGRLLGLTGCGGWGKFDLLFGEFLLFFDRGKTEFAARRFDTMRGRCVFRLVLVHFFDGLDGDFLWGDFFRRRCVGDRFELRSDGLRSRCRFLDQGDVLLRVG
jgi:hypothetical protein